MAKLSYYLIIWSDERRKKIHGKGSLLTNTWLKVSATLLESFPVLNKRPFFVAILLIAGFITTVCISHNGKTF